MSSSGLREVVTPSGNVSPFLAHSFDSKVERFGLVQSGAGQMSFPVLETVSSGIHPFSTGYTGTGTSSVKSASFL